MGSKSKSKSYNANNELIKSTFGGAADATGRSVNMMTQLLKGDDGAFSKWQEGTGYSSIFDEAMRGVNSGAAGTGVYGSGARYKALQDRAGTVASSSYNDYVQQLLGLGQLGLGAGGLITSAGQVSKSKTKGGLGEAAGGIGGLMSGAAAAFGPAAPLAAASDRRLKKNIEKIGELTDGLGIYVYSYVWDHDDDIQIGTMADEVASLRPWALGPVTDDGYMSVDYNRIDEGVA